MTDQPECTCGDARSAVARALTTGTGCALHSLPTEPVPVVPLRDGSDARRLVSRALDPATEFDNLPPAAA